MSQHDPDSSLIIWIFAIFFAGLFLLSLSTTAERFFWASMADLELGPECSRLEKCLNAGDQHYQLTNLDSDNRCVVKKLRPGHPEGDYVRSYRIPELRGSLRTCEMIRGFENQDKF